MGCKAGTVYYKSSRRVFSTFLISLLCFSSCRRGNDPALIKHYNEKIFSRALGLFNDGLINESRRLVDSAYKAFPEVSLADECRYNSFLYNAYNSYYSPVRNYDSALRYADNNLRLIEKNGKTEQMAREYALAYSQKGAIHIERRSYDEAFKCFSRSRLIAEGIHDSCMLAEYNSTLGLVLYRQSKISAAIGYYKQSLAAIRNCENNADKYHQVQGWLDNVGFSYFKLGMQDSAWVYFKKAERYIEDNKALYSAEPKFPEIAIGVVYGNEAQVLQATGKYAEAEELFKKAIAINLKKGYDNNSAIVTQLRLAGFYIEWKKPEKAAALLHDVKEVLPRTDNDTRLLWKKTRWEYDSVYRPGPEANASLIDYWRFRDSVDHTNKRLGEISMKDDFDHLEREYAINLLQKENALKQAHLAASIAILIMVSIIGLMILRNLRRSRRMVRTLRRLNDEIKERELQLEGLLAELEVKDKQKNRILRTVAHDLRNPISGINMIGTVLVKRHTEEREYQQLIRLMLTACSDSLALVGEILTATDAQKDAVLEKKPVDIDTLILESVGLLRFNASEKQQTITVFPLHKAYTVLVDTEKIRRVINNLVSNAIKFSVPGKEITVTMTENGSFCRISVKDSGIGIPLKDQDKVFDMFTVARRAGTGGEKSFGLGLSICLQIIKAHDGKIWLESEPGAGTIFYVELKGEFP